MLVAYVCYVDSTQKVELVQDLHFDTAATRIKATADGKFLVASG